MTFCGTSGTSTTKGFYADRAELYSLNLAVQGRHKICCNYLPTATDKCNETWIFRSSPSLLWGMTRRMLNHSQCSAWKQPTACGGLWAGLWLENMDRGGMWLEKWLEIQQPSVHGGCEKTKQLVWNIQVPLRKRRQDDDVHSALFAVKTFNGNVYHVSPSLPLAAFPINAEQLRIAQQMNENLRWQSRGQVVLFS